MPNYSHTTETLLADAIKRFNEHGQLAVEYFNLWVATGQQQYLNLAQNHAAQRDAAYAEMAQLETLGKAEGALIEAQAALIEAQAREAADQTRANEIQERLDRIRKQIEEAQKRAANQKSGGITEITPRQIAGANLPAGETPTPPSQNQRNEGPELLARLRAEQAEARRGNAVNKTPGVTLPKEGQGDGGKKSSLNGLV